MYVKITDRSIVGEYSGELVKYEICIRCAYDRNKFNAIE